jgi:uncharacterized protein (DUF983 family)
MLTVQIVIQPEAQAEAEARPVMQSITRGASGKCPQCGRGRLFWRYLKVADVCPECGEELHHQRADDAPPYFTIAIVGHIVVPLLLALELAYQPPVWLHLAIWMPLTILLCLLLLPIVKGGLVGLQWALRMHGFSGEPDVVPTP